MIDFDINSMYPSAVNRMRIDARGNLGLGGPGHGFNTRYWPHVTQVNHRTLTRDVERWCYTNLRSGNWRNNGTWFAFKREQDYMMFLLKFS